MGTSDRPDEQTISTVEAAWHQHRRRVLDIGYRMSGSLAEAEDVAQEVFSRLLVSDIDRIDDVGGWLVTVTTRLCIDRLRLHENSRRSYVGPWLPEPLVDGADVVGDQVTLDDTVRTAFLVVLDRLSPAERASFLLHDVFGLSFADVGEIVGRTPAASRQLASRARRRIRSDDPLPDRHAGDRSAGPSDEDRRIVERFAAACRAGDLAGLIEVLATDAAGHFDSGGGVPGAPLTELVGAQAIAAQLLATVSRIGADFEVAAVNGGPGLVLRAGTRVIATISIEVTEGRITLLHAVGNPSKLARLQPGQADRRRSSPPGVD